MNDFVVGFVDVQVCCCVDEVDDLVGFEVGCLKFDQCFFGVGFEVDGECVGVYFVDDEVVFEVYVGWCFCGDELFVNNFDFQGQVGIQ